MPESIKQQLIVVSERAAFESELAEAGLEPGRPVVVLIGGAANLDHPESVDLKAIIRDGVIATAQAIGAIVIDGGTDSGVMAIAGQAHDELAGTIPLLGVAPIGRIAAEGILEAVGSTPLEPHHTHIVLTPGDRWGAELPWLIDAARILSRGRAVVAVVIDGGEIAAVEAEEALAQGWPVVALAGSGRTADDLAMAARQAAPDGGDSTARGRVVVRDIGSGGSELAATLRSMFEQPS